MFVSPMLSLEGECSFLNIIPYPRILFQLPLLKHTAEEGEALIDDRPWDSRSPTSIAAAVVFLITQLPR
jgi:hypothetical protein